MLFDLASRGVPIPYEGSKLRGTNNCKGHSSILGCKPFLNTAVKFQMGNFINHVLTCTETGSARMWQTWEDTAECSNIEGDEKLLKEMQHTHTHTLAIGLKGVS